MSQPIVTVSMASPSSGISAGLASLKGVTMVSNTPGIRDGAARNGRSNHGTPKGFEKKGDSDTSSTSSAGSKPGVKKHTVKQKIGPKAGSGGPQFKGIKSPDEVTADPVNDEFAGLHARLAGIDRLRSEAVCAEAALCASTPDPTQHTEKMKNLYQTLDNYKSDVSELLLGAVARECAQLHGALNDTPSVPFDEPPDVWALTQVVNYSVAQMPERSLPANYALSSRLAFCVLAPLFFIYSILYLGETARSYCETIIILVIVYRSLPRSVLPLLPLNPRRNVFIDVKSEVSLMPIGTPHLNQQPGTDDIMVYNGYHTNYTTMISLKMLDHLKTAKSGSKLTEMNVLNMAHEICQKFPSKYPFEVYQETAIHAHQLFQAARMRRQMTCSFETHAPLRQDARAWNPS